MVSNWFRFVQVGCWSLAVLLTSLQGKAEWNQWRGPQRDGTIQGPSILAALPATGLEPVWINSTDVAGGGGWSSPVIAGGRVYQYCHDQIRRQDVKLPPPKYPALSEEQKQKMSPEEVAEYDKKRAEENQERNAQMFDFADRVVCLDAETGKRLWEHKRDSRQTTWRQSSTPAVAEGRLYFVGADRKLVCVDTETRAEVWTAAIPGQEPPAQGRIEPVASSPLLADGRVFVLAERLIAFDARQGEVLWTSEAEQKGSVFSSPALWRSKNGLRILVNLGGTTCLDAADGRELWRIPSHAGRSTPIVQGDALVTYGGSRKGGVRRYDMSEQSAELKWTSHRFADPGSSPVVAGNRVIVQGERNFACLNFENGEILWQTTLDLTQPRYTSPIAVGDTVLYTFGGVLGISAKANEFAPLFDARISKDGLLASEEFFKKTLNLDSLPGAEAEKQWNRQITSQGPRACVSPAFADGRLYLRLNGALACYDLRADAGK